MRECKRVHDTNQQIDNTAHPEFLDFALDDLPVLQQVLQQLLDSVHKAQTLLLQHTVIAA